MSGKHRQRAPRRHRSVITVTSATLAAGGLLAGSAYVGPEVNVGAVAACEPGGSGAIKAADYATVIRDQQIAVKQRVAASRDIEAWPVCGRHANDNLPARHAAPSPPRHATPVVPDAVPASPAPISRTVDHVVASGDTLAQIAAAHSMAGGWQQIYNDNRASIADPNALSVGQHLKVLGTDRAAVKVTAAPAVVARTIIPKRVAAVAPAPAKKAKPSATTSAVPAAQTADLHLATRVVTAAVAQQGTPYVYGGSAPGGFDCSGLVQWSYKKIGVALPRTAAAQATVGRRVNVNQLQPGDLLFYYQPVGHVVMYVGNGKIVEASQPGKPVQVRPMYLSGFVGARRVL